VNVFFVAAAACSAFGGLVVGGTHLSQPRSNIAIPVCTGSTQNLVQSKLLLIISFCGVEFYKVRICFTFAGLRLTDLPVYYS
jgi:hypothetical protein